MPANETIQYIPLDQIDTEQQPREMFDDAAIDGLAVTMEEVGQLQPIRIRKGKDKFIVVEGERRLRAARKSKMAKIAAIVETGDLDEGDILHRQLVADCQKEHLLPLERASAISRLMEAKGYSAAEVAARSGMSAGSVAKYLALLDLPANIRERVGDGSIAASAAYELAQIVDPVRQAELADQLADGRLTRDGLSGIRRRRTEPNGTSNKPEAGRATAVLAQGRQVTVRGQNLSLEMLIQCLEELLGKARKARSQGIELATFLRMLRDQAVTA